MMLLVLWSVVIPKTVIRWWMLFCALFFTLIVGLISHNEQSKGNLCHHHNKWRWFGALKVAILKCACSHQPSRWGHQNPNTCFTDATCCPHSRRLLLLVYIWCFWEVWEKKWDTVVYLPSFNCWRLVKGSVLQTEYFVVRHCFREWAGLAACW